jgi:DNA-binding CsgD family transcriptional regulator
MAGKPGQGIGESKTSKRRVIAQEREARALDMRKAGATYQQIANTLNVSRPAAYKMVARSLHEMKAEHVDEVRQLELTRLDALVLALWKQALAGDVQVVDRVLKIMDRRAAYLGLDAPKVVKIDLEARIRAAAEENGMDPDLAVAEAQALIAAAKARNAGTG